MMLRQSYDVYSTNKEYLTKTCRVLSKIVIFTEYFKMLLLLSYMFVLTFSWLLGKFYYKC